jgi:hypothetical protein
VNQNQDREHLRLLSIFHYIVGGLSILFGLFPIVHLVVGLAMVTGRMGDGPPDLFGWVFVIMASLMIAFGVALGILCIVAAGRLKNRTHYTFCFIVACIECAFMPFGTILGVFTIIVLTRDSVKALFE